MLARYDDAKREGRTHPLVLIGALILDLLASIYESRNTYYATLSESQRDWHGGGHSIWPWTSYLTRVVADAYDDFEQRVAAASNTAVSKQARVRDYILHEAPPTFRRREVERALPGISPATIRLVLNELRDAGRIKAEGSGPSARWRRLQGIPKR